MCELAAALDDRGRKPLLEDITATEGESQPALPNKHMQIATRPLTNMVLLFSKGSHAVAEELLADVRGRVLGECVTPILDQKIVNNLVHTFNMVQADFCDLIFAGEAPSHRDPNLDVNGFYNRNISILRAVADRLGVPVNKMYRGMHEKLLALPATWCFDMPGHGKGTCDGLGAGIKKMLGNSMCGLEDVHSPSECVQHLCRVTKSKPLCGKYATFCEYRFLEVKGKNPFPPLPPTSTVVDCTKYFAWQSINKKGNVQRRQYPCWCQWSTSPDPIYKRCKNVPFCGNWEDVTIPLQQTLSSTDIDSVVFGVLCWSRNAKNPPPPTPPTSSSRVINGCKQGNTCECLATWNEWMKNFSFVGCQANSFS